ncbi:MAG: MAPEG family protein [Gammaproteobacteria bacterium]
MPIVLYTLFLASVFPIVLSAIGIYVRIKQLGKFDNDHPRAQQARLVGSGARVVAAQQNAWEALAVYVAVVLIAHASGVNLNELAIPAIIFITFRVLHAFLYIRNYSTLRSLAFAISMFSCLYIVYVSATYS